VGALLAALVGLAGPVGAAEPPRPLARSVERAVAALAAKPADVGPNICVTACGSPTDEHETNLRPYMNGALASGVGLAVGLSAGVALGRPDAGTGAPALRGGWQTGDTVVAGTTLAALAAMQAFDHAPEALADSRWSDCDGGRDALNGLDRRIAEALGGGRWRRSASVTSNMTLWSVGGLALGLGGGAQPDEGGRDLAVISGAFVVNAALHDVVRRLFDRPRPCAHFCRLHGRGDPSAHARSSFYSGHTSAAFTLAVAAGMLGHYHGYRNEGWVWASGLTLATATGALRIVADEHYFTDVAAGAAAGALVGYLMPRLHRPEPTARADASARPERPTLVSLPLRLPPLSGQGALRAGVGSGFTLEASWRW
jgi:membrane-associated phospholipid phosphatase